VIFYPRFLLLLLRARWVLNHAYHRSSISGGACSLRLLKWVKHQEAEPAIIIGHGEAARAMYGNKNRLVRRTSRNSFPTNADNIKANTRPFDEYRVNHHHFVSETLQICFGKTFFAANKNN
jgi:hypothetical protein